VFQRSPVFDKKAPVVDFFSGKRCRKARKNLCRNPVPVDRLFQSGAACPPLDDFFFDLLATRVDPSSGLIADSTPPFKLYPANTNHTAGGVDPFAASRFEARWYRLASEQARAHGSKHAWQCGLSDAPTCDR